MSEELEEATAEEMQEAQELASFIRGSFKWKLAYAWMQILLVIEGFLWSFMDMARRSRMKVSARINSNYKRYNDEI